jgi:ABC-type spermidine/putrescine transport system permease subunit I
LRARRDILLLLPAVVVLAVFLLAPLLLAVDESFRFYVPGRVGAARDAPYTWQNYADLLNPAYFRYFADTFRIGLVASAIALVAGYPIAYHIARLSNNRWRRAWLTFLVTLFFLSILVRVYSIALAFGPAGFGRGFGSLLGLSLNSGAYVELTIMIGLLHCLIPMAAFSLLAPLQNLNPHLVEAAQALGAPSWKAHATITLPLSAGGILAAFMLCFTFCLSAFVIPLVLGKGRILFVSNLIYSRFGEVGDYPSGAAISVVLLLLSLAVVYALTRAATQRQAS